MSLTYGFYNSLNGDRRYTAEQISRIFSGVINDGVFMSIGDQLRVSASDKMTVIVGSGRAWFDGTWTDNDTEYAIDIPVSELVLNRIDAVVLEVNTSESVRANSIKVISGTPATTPSKPTLTNSGVVHQYPLAYVTVKSGVTTIKQSDINNAVGTSQCPWVTGILETINTDELIAQWAARFDELYATLENAIEQTLAAEVVDGSVTMTKLAPDVISAMDVKLSTFVAPTGANTLSFTVKGAGSSTSNAWRRQMLTIQAWSQGADFINMQLMVDVVNGAPYGGAPCFVTFERNLPVTSVVYVTEDDDTRYTITFKADAMWALGYVTYKAGLNMSVDVGDILESGTSLAVNTHVGHVIEYAKKVGSPRNLLDNSDFRDPVNQRARTSYSNGYTIDRWYSSNANINVIVGNRKITLSKTKTGGTFCQYLPVNVTGKKLTLVINTSIGLLLRSFVSDGDNLTQIDGLSAYFGVKVSNNITQVLIYFNNSDTIEFDLYWAALYEGEYTAETLPEYQTPDFQEEFDKCQRYLFPLGGAASGGDFSISGFVASSGNVAEFVLPKRMRYTDTNTNVGSIENRNYSKLAIGVHGTNAWINPIDSSYRIDGNGYPVLRFTFEGQVTARCPAVLICMDGNIRYSQDL